MSVRPSASVYNIILGSALAASSVFCIASIVAASSATGHESFFASPGSFLLGAFSWAAAFVPLWLAASAVIAFTPGWRPAAIVGLSGSVLPFLPLLAVARLGAEPEPFLSDHPYLGAVGLPALVAAGIALALALVAFIIYAAKTIAGFGSSETEPPRVRIAACFLLRFLLDSLPVPRSRPGFGSREDGGKLRFPSSRASSPSPISRHRRDRRCGGHRGC